MKFGREADAIKPIGSSCNLSRFSAEETERTAEIKVGMHDNIDRVVRKKTNLPGLQVTFRTKSALVLQSVHVLNFPDWQCMQNEYLPVWVDAHNIDCGGVAMSSSKCIVPLRTGSEHDTGR